MRRMIGLVLVILMIWYLCDVAVKSHKDPAVMTNRIFFQVAYPALYLMLNAVSGSEWVLSLLTDSEDSMNRERKECNKYLEIFAIMKDMCSETNYEAGCSRYIENDIVLFDLTKGINNIRGRVRTAPQMYYEVNIELVDMRPLYQTLYPNITFKFDEPYYINRKAYQESKFIEAMSVINKTHSCVIVSTTQGDHANVELGHRDGYKVDIRTKDKTFEEVFYMVQVLQKKGLKVVYEFSDSQSSIDMASKLSEQGVKTISINITKGTDEHLDISLIK